MRKLLVALVVVAAGWVAVGMTGSAAQDEKTKATIKEVMQICMKGGLCKKVAGGDASAE